MSGEESLSEEEALKERMSDVCAKAHDYWDKEHSS